MPGVTAKEQPAAPASAAPQAAAVEQKDPGPVQAGPPRANIESLEIQSAEIQFMNELAPVLGRSPRALKRFVNVYRIVKAELTNAEYRGFLDESHGTYRVALFLLAVDTGTPLALAQVFTAIMAQREQEPARDASWLVSALELAGTSDNHSRLDEERRRLRDWVFERRFEPFLSNPEVMARWAERIARYSFGAHALELIRAPGLQLTVSAEPEA
jgi:hypothetical protein